MSKELRVSKVRWKRLRRILVGTALAGATATVGAYALSSGDVWLSADGLVIRQSVAIAAPWQDARIREVYVRPGDWVTAGQTIAVVELAAMARSLADLAAEKARLVSRLAQHVARKTVVSTLLPLAEANAAQAEAFLGTILKAGANGMAVNKTVQEMMSARVQASDRYLSLKAEQGSLQTEAEANQNAFNQVAAAYDDLQRTYDNGKLYAIAGGHIGGNVAMVGEVLSPGRDKVASVYTGENFVLAYVPESYLFDLKPGDKVAVKARGQVVDGRIEKLLQVTEALPPEFQLPNRVRGRGQLARIELLGRNNFAVDQKVLVTSCYLENCRIGLSEMIRAIAPGFQSVGRKIAELFKRVDAPALALSEETPVVSVSAKTGS